MVSQLFKFLVPSPCMTDKSTCLLQCHLHLPGQDTCCSDRSNLEGLIPRLILGVTYFQCNWSRHWDQQRHLQGVADQSRRVLPNWHRRQWLDWQAREPGRLLGKGSPKLMDVIVHCAMNFHLFRISQNTDFSRYIFPKYSNTIIAKSVQISVR